MSSLKITTADYVEYLQRAYAIIHKNGEYVTSLDAATGDGDHWTNLNTGFERLLELGDELGYMSFSDAFKKIGMLLMSVIGGSGGVLYGSAYVQAGKALADEDTLGLEEICRMLEVMYEAIAQRGKAERGHKTMLDSLGPAVDCFKECLAEGRTQGAYMLAEVKQAAIDGAESTKNMEAVRGRAYYQANKGLGHLDPGAVTMAYQIEALMDFLTEKLKTHS